MSLRPHRLLKPRLLVLSISRLGWMALALGFSLFLGAAHARAQDKAPGKTDNTTDKKSDEEVKIPEPEPFELEADNGLIIKGTYFPGTKGEESIPVILLHGFDKPGTGPKHSGKDFTQPGGLAPFLQEKLGCAVIVPDLRGHGESNKIPVGKKVEDFVPKGKRLTPAQISKMPADLRAVKKFLWMKNYDKAKNNEKALNLEKLTVIGVEEGAALAMCYTVDDLNGYEDGRARVGPLHLGKFVKALVLISPVTKVLGLNTTAVTKVLLAPRSDGFLLPLMIVAGNKNKIYFAEAERLHTLFLKSRPPAEDAKPESITVWFFPKIDTTLQGAELLAQPALKVPEKIVNFMTVWLVKNPDAKEWKWRQLKKPYE